MNRRSAIIATVLGWFGCQINTAKPVIWEPVSWLGQNCQHSNRGDAIYRSASSPHGWWLRKFGGEQSGPFENEEMAKRSACGEDERQ